MKIYRRFSIPVWLVAALLASPYVCFAETHFVEQDAAAGSAEMEMDAWRATMRQTLAEVEQGGNVLVTTVTYAYLDFFENWRCSVELQGLSSVKYLVFANDKASHIFLQKKGIPVVLNPALLNATSQETSGEEMKWGSPEYQNLMGERTKFLLTVLEEGYNVLTFDADAIWEKDPLPYLDRSYDLVVVQEQPWSKLTQDGVWGLEVCGCFLYLVNTPVTKALLTETINLFYRPRFSYNEQKVLGYLLQYRAGTPWENVRLHFLPKPEFPNGREYYGYHWENAQPFDDDAKSRVVVLHNNWVQGHSVKKQRWVDDGHWYISEQDGGEAFAEHGLEHIPSYTCRRSAPKGIA